MRATDIDWDVSMEDVCDNINSMSDEEAAEVLGVDAEELASMTDNERDILIDKVFGSSNLKREQLFNLPSEVEIPPFVSDENVCDWLSDQFNFACFGCFAV